MYAVMSCSTHVQYIVNLQTLNNISIFSRFANEANLIT